MADSNVKRYKIWFEIFEKDLHPEVVAQMRGWKEHLELSKILKKLESIKNWEEFLGFYAEAMVAYHLVSRGCEIKVKTSTEKSEGADFEVFNGNDTFYVRVKRLDFGRKIEHYTSSDDRISGPQKQRFSSLFGKSLAIDERQPSNNGSCRFSKEAGGSLNVILVTSEWAGKDSIRALRECTAEFWSTQEHCYSNKACSNIIGHFNLDHRGKSIIDFSLFRRGSDEIPTYISELFECNSVKCK